MLRESEAVHLVLWRPDFGLKAFCCVERVKQLERLKDLRLFRVPAVGEAEAVFVLEAQVSDKDLHAREQDSECGKRDGCAHLGRMGSGGSVVYT